MSINLNNIAKEIAEVEGKKEQLSIAQIKEVLRILFTYFTLRTLVEMHLKVNK